MKRFFISTLEHSGDIAGAELVNALQCQLRDNGEDTEFYGLGGSAMQNVGVKIIENTVDNAIMGFTTVISEIPRMLTLMKNTAKFIRASSFDAVIVIDAPDFNIRFAKHLQSTRSRTPLVYFILPQVWAWRQGRSRQIENLFDLKFPVFPFETRWFTNRHVDVTYIGNPTAYRVQHFLSQHNRAEDREKFNLPTVREANAPVVAILPGSRKSEIRNLLNVQIQAMNKLTKDFQQITGILAVAPDRNLDIYEPFLQNVDFNLKIAIPRKTNNLDDKSPIEIGAKSFRTYDADALTVMSICDAGLVCSGTATLEAALLNLPSVVGYIANTLNFWIARAIVSIRTISIANLVLEKAVYPELIQHICTPDFMCNQLKKMLSAEFGEYFATQHDILWYKIGELNPFVEASKLIINKTNPCSSGILPDSLQH